ncbi:MAG: hypothetical protein ACLPJY_01550 [Rhodomicrobium sp.]
MKLLRLPILTCLKVKQGEMLRTKNKSKRFKQFFGRLWSRFVADECPEDVRKKRIANMMHDVILFEAMRRWERETKQTEPRR